MNPIDVIMSYPPEGPLLFFTGSPDFSDPIGRLIGLDPSVNQILGMLNDAAGALPF